MVSPPRAVINPAIVLRLHKRFLYVLQHCEVNTGVQTGNRQQLYAQINEMVFAADAAAAAAVVVAAVSACIANCFRIVPERSFGLWPS